MSWQSYVDDHLIKTGKVTQAAIAGHDGSVWAKSAGFSGTPSELKMMSSFPNNPSQFQASGIMIGGIKYMFLSADDKRMRGKKNTSGIHAMKTGQTLIVCLYDEPIQPGECAQVTETLGEYLIKSNF